ncbi:MAG: thrombospondin type 3 repeat-containing protein [Candidatus Paceibacterota bacterium]|jgi:hypothetical protein
MIGLSLTKKYKKYAPSRNFIVLCATVIVAIGLVAIGVRFSALKQAQSANRAKIAVLSESEKTPAQIFIETDTDKDSLPDWQETLLGTNLKNPDTDKDGSTDGEEINQNRDPLKANTAKTNQEPNDKINPELIEQAKKDFADYQKLTATEKTAQAFFSEYLATKKVNSELSSADKQVLLDDMIKNINSATATSSKKYRVNDLKIINDLQELSTSTIHNYGNAMASAFFVKPSQNIQADLEIIKNSLVSENPKDLEKLDKNIAEYNKIIKDLLSMTVPASAANLHVYFLNTLQSISNDLAFSKRLYSDAIYSLQGFMKYPSDLKALLASFRSLKTYLEANKIQFTPRESGYMIIKNVI